MKATLHIPGIHHPEEVEIGPLFIVVFALAMAIVAWALAYAPALTEITSVLTDPGLAP